MLPAADQIFAPVLIGGVWMLLICGRGNVKALKCLMGVGQGSRVRATNDNVLRRMGVQAS